MKPAKFPQSNKLLTKPSDMTDEECSALNVWTDNSLCISLWRPTFLERLKILIFGNLWLWVRSGGTQPPVAIEVENPFDG